MKFILVLLAAFSTVGCGFAIPDAGQEAVLVRKPYLFGHGGVEATPIKTGRSVVAVSTDVVYVNIQPQRIDLAFDDLMTMDGVPIDFHAVLTYQVLDAVKLVRDFGADWVGNQPGFFMRNLEQPFRTAVRDEVKKHGMNEMAIQVTAAEDVDRVVTGHLQTIIQSTGVPVKLIDLSLGRANPPDAILSQRVETAAQEQRINSEKQRKLAEDQRKLAEESRAAADNAYRQQMSLSPDQFLRLETIKMQRDVCAGGKCTFLLGGVVPTLDVGK
jgi:regulator of protease activity HflC (stomatin/prohibitin superfamily)